MADFRSSSAVTPSLPRSTGRRSQPGIWTPYSEGGIGIIPRRNLAAPGLLRTSASLASYAYGSPLRLLTTIIDSDVDVSLAADNIITLTTGDVQIVAQPPGDANAAPDAAGTAVIEEFLQSLPPEIGGLPGLQATGTLMNLCTGMSALEAVPGEALAGLTRLWPVDSLSLMLARHDRNSDVAVLQKQWNADPALVDPLYPGFVRMDPATFFWKPYQPMVDDPYGRAGFGPAIAEVLRNLHVLQSLQDCVDHTAWPRGIVTVDTTILYEMAMRLGYEDSKENPAATQYVLDQYQAAVTGVQDLKADDWMVLGANGKAVMMQGGTFAGLDMILKEMRSRVVRGLKQLPIMMAFQEGSTEGHTTVQWQVYARRLEGIRSAVLAPILKAISLHLRLLGLNLHAVAKYEPIRTTDKLVDSQTTLNNLRNGAGFVLLGLWTMEQFSLAMTGTGPVAGYDIEDLRAIAGLKVGGASPSTAGSSQDELDAQKSQNGQGS